jgi:hypothetical protein
MALNIFGQPPEYLSGLLGIDPEKLRKQAFGTGLVNTALAFAAQPRNQGYGSVLPYAARALMAGQQGAQGVYQGALQDYQTRQQIEQLKRQQAQQQAQQELLSGIEDPTQRLAAQLAPTEYAKSVLRPLEARARLMTKEEQVQAGLPEQGRYQVKPDGTFDLVPGTAPKETATPASIQEYNFARSQGFTGSFQDWKETQKPAGVTVSVGGETFAKEFGKGTAANIQDSYNQARAAQDTLNRIQDLRPVIKQGVFAGPLSTSERTVAQVASKLGTTGADTEDTLRRTAEAMQGLAQFELNAAAAMRGQGAITENERMIIQRAAAGRLDQFTAPEVLTLLDALEKTNKFKVQGYQKTFKQLEKSPEAAQFIDFYRLPEVQTQAPSATTPQERARQELERRRKGG